MTPRAKVKTTFRKVSIPPPINRELKR